MIYIIYLEWRYEWTIKTINSLEDSRVLINGVTETVKHEIKKQESRLLEALLADLAAWVCNQ